MRDDAGQGELEYDLKSQADERAGQERDRKVDDEVAAILCSDNEMECALEDIIRDPQFVAGFRQLMVVCVVEGGWLPELMDATETMYSAARKALREYAEKHIVD